MGSMGCVNVSGVNFSATSKNTNSIFYFWEANTITGIKSSKNRKTGTYSNVFDVELLSGRISSWPSHLALLVNLTTKIVYSSVYHGI